MITGDLKSKIDRIWDTMWAGGISNPLSVIEQLTYLLFIKRLDELHTLRERKAARTGQAIEQAVFTPDQDELRWSRFKELAPEPMFEVVKDGVFPFIKTLGSGSEDDSTYTHHMRDALFLMPSPRLLANVVDQLDAIDMADRDTKGDLYEYMLGKIASAGQNGQFRTPRHIIQLMVQMMRPTPQDTICDPACGTAGFLIAASEHLVDHHSEEIYQSEASRKRFNSETFHGYDFDNTMLRIGSMNMLLHGVENPDIRYRDSLAEAAEDDAEKYSLILANPPFAGSLDYESTAKDLQKIVKTKKTELLFLALFLRLLQTGGRAAVIVPDGVLFGSSKAHKELRRILVEDQKLDAIVSMPSGVFKPYAGVSTAILFFTKTNSGGTDHVWFYDMQADGYSLDDKRTPQPDKTDLPDLLTRWQSLQGAPASRRDTDSPEHTRKRTEQSFLVPKDEIASHDYDLSLNRYKEVEYEAIEHDAPADILQRLTDLEKEIETGRRELESLLG
ncbi:MAG: class I SAM-dependent DNA methyltransferase [Verrucomicrobiota bacterium JB023]|nr:class I SAM-dependent DNA methyltransferase [Verrucomicrobiota bacterium JB023]